ncbi:hypothetical protein ACQP1P_38815 [Dactylosporangium sp. CA-052675]|uniref:hypothetical protein n=1 Tax=Dactylosporangium sp. CA-052675 TaxID=3239927 RepID=UPI003D8DC96A
MSADLLRRAAAKLREHAEKASGGDWDADGTELYAENGAIWIGQMDGDEKEGVANASLAALMHPPVALALAAAMDEVAVGIEYDPMLLAAFGYAELIAVARAVLREEAS